MLESKIQKNILEPAIYSENERLAHLNELPLVDGAIDLTQFIKIPGGGTHDIYRLNEHSPILVKIVKASVGNDVETLEMKLAELTQKYQALYQVFGEKQCLVESRCIRPIKENAFSPAKEAIISLVAYDNCFKSKDRFGFNVESTEMKEFVIQENTEKYHSMNRSLLGEARLEKQSDNEDFLFFNESFRSIFDLIDNDQSLKEAMQEFLVKFKQYYEKTDQLMDFTGRDNVLFYKEGDSWQYKIGSVIKHETGKKTRDMIDEIDQNPLAVQESFEKWTPIFFSPSWIRALNVTSQKLGLDKIVENITLSENDSENLSRMYEKVGMNLRAVTHAEHNHFETALPLFQEYQNSGKDHDTMCQDMLGTKYWHWIQENNIKPPEQEMSAYLNLLTDPKNDFPEYRKSEVNAAVAGLQARLKEYAQDIFEKFADTLNDFESAAEKATDFSLDLLANAKPIIHANDNASAHLANSAGTEIQESANTNRHRQMM